MKKIFLLFFLIGLIPKQIFLNINFANQSSAIAVKRNSKLKLNDTSKVKGWSLKSVIKDFGNNSANQWSAENYGSDTIISQDGTGTSLAITNLVYSNSNSLKYHGDIIRNNSYFFTTNSDLMLYDIKNNSNALLYGIKNNSNALVYHIKNNSNTLLYGIRNNSNAISIPQIVNDIKANSNALIFATKNNSNAILYATKNNSNALNHGIKNNSNALVYGLKNNSNALLYGIKNNSNAIVSGIKNNSNALLNGVKNNSNALVYGIKNNNNALLFGIKNNSNTLIYDIKNNSNAINYGIKNNSNSILVLDNYINTEPTGNVRANSRNIVYNSNGLLNFNNYVRTQVDGNIRANSRNILYNSNALLNFDNYVRTQVDGNIRANSRNISYNSNALLNLDNYVRTQIDGNIRANSRNIVYNSNGLLNLDDYVRTQVNGSIRANSRNIVYNSNAIISGIKNNSNAILKNTRDITANSNTIAYYAPIIRNNSYLLKNTSNAIVYFSTQSTPVPDIDYLRGTIRSNSRNIAYNSNTINYYAPTIRNNSYLLKNTSNAVVYLIDNVTTIPDLNVIRGSIRANSRNIAYNSNAINLHDQYFNTIDHGYNYLGDRKYLDLGDGNNKDLLIHTVAGNIYRLNSDIYLSSDHKLILPTGYSMIDGNGHNINFAQTNYSENNNIIVIPENTTVTTTNIVLHNFNPEYIQLNSGSNFIFDNNTTIEILNNIDLNQTWSFAGNTILNCFGNQINLNKRLDSINILNSGNLTIKDTRVNKLKESNLHTTHKTGSFTLSNCELILDNDFSFTIGTIKFDQNVLISGTHAFVYESVLGSTIDSNSILKIDMNSTFSYAPAREKSSNNPTNLIMQDFSSILFLDGASLYSTNTGLLLKNGILRLDHKNFLYNRDGFKNASSVSESIIFGDQTDILTLEILPGASIELISGILTIN